MSGKKKKHVFRDVLISTIFTFLLILLLKLVFFNTHYLDPISNALSDFQFTDLYYSAIRSKSNAVNKDIVIVNIGDNSRAQIAEQLQIIESHGPKIIGLDVTFPQLKDSASDQALKEALHGNVPVVLASQFVYEAAGEEEAHGSHHETKAKRDIITSNPFFEVEKQEGFGSFLAEEGTTTRYYKPFSVAGEGRLHSFSAKIAEIADKDAYTDLETRKKDSEVIHYTDESFITLDANEITADNPQLDILRGKIVLMGYMGPQLGTKVFEDLHLTPLNKSYGGHSIPDTYGIEIHAHVLSMILQRDYIHEPGKFMLFIISFFVALLHMYLFAYFFVEKHFWFHLAAKTIQLLSFALMLLVSLLVYHYFHVKLEPALLLIAVLLGVDALYLVEALIKWMHRKFRLESYFISDHH
jgi:CHASE2 domain-containing sensor protein